MTMRFVDKYSIPSATDGALKLIYAWLDFMRTASPAGPGWSIVQSSDGKCGDANVNQDNISSYGDLTWFNQAAGGTGNGTSWFVLQAPTGTAQFMWGRYDASDVNWRVYYSPGGLYTGGAQNTLPSATDQVNYGWGRFSYNYVMTAHFGADDAAPYGFWMHAHANGNFSTTYGMWAWVPLDSVAAGDTDPYIWIRGDQNYGLGWTRGYLSTENTYQYTRCAAILPGSSVSETVPALYYVHGSNQVIVPNRVAVDQNGDDVTFPVVFGRRSDLSAPTGYKGISTFMKWNGAERAAGETFASRTRISWGDVNFPWSGNVPESA